MKDLYISRKLTKDSPIRAFCTNNNVSFFDFSLLKFSGIAFDFPNHFDWLFFYSKNGIRYLFEGFEDDINPKTKFACFGPATAEYLLKEHGKASDFIGQGVAFSMIKDFEKSLAITDKIGFIQAQNSLQSIQKMLDPAFQAQAIITYDNVINKDKEPPNTSILVFTSPMNVKAYFSQISPPDSATLVAIGGTTKSEMTKWTHLKIHTPLFPNEKMLLKLITDLIK